MTGAGFILAINLIVAGLLAAAFLAIAAYDRRRVAGRWMALGYGLLMVYFGLEFVIASVGRLPVVLVGAFAACLAALLAMNVALARKYADRVPWRLLIALFVVSVAVNIAILPLPRESFLRQMLYQLPYFAMGAAGVKIVFEAKHRRGLDSLLVGVLAAFSLQFVAKPFLAIGFGGVGAHPSQYITTTYAQISQSMGTVFVLAMALLMMVILMRDIAGDLARRSEIDALSGLLNRRGFEDRMRSCLRRAAQSGVPVSLVICDLDRFKAVNDTYGHAAGDQAITVFAETLRAQLRPDDIAARIGGEEFAVMLPATNLAAARLFAESVRAAISSVRIDVLPAAERLTASFGVAELLRGEHSSELMHRADSALYKAKRAGRDRVRLAPSADNDAGRDAQVAS
ncbi:MAG: GGDEF domain-containing protein [Rhizobiaceae bacterium]|nr:GGDEF domain-containing protein [Rhizobiaceae bacterium]MCV0407353.1 GGDEF domain-containing protein [Rhizobiaceae bacterium]